MEHSVLCGSKKFPVKDPFMELAKGSLNTFLNAMTDYGYTYIGIYASWNWLSAEGAHLIDIDSLPSYVPYWVAQYNSHNDLADEYPNAAIRVWQYTDHYSDQFPYDANVYD